MIANHVPPADLLIVGAGPTGLYAAYCAGFRGLSTIVVDSLPQPGGQVMALYPEKTIRDVAAIPAVRGRDFITALTDQAASFDPTYLLGRRATGLELQTDGDPVVTLDDGTVVRTRAVLLTAGIGTPTPRPLEGGERWLGRGLSYFVLDPEEHRDRHVVVVGGGDSALDWSETLAPLAASVTLVHRRATFRGHAATLEAVRSLNVDIRTSTQVMEFVGEPEPDRFTHLRVRHDSGAVCDLRADHVIAALGFVSDLGPLRDWGLEMDARSVSVDRSMRTSVDRIFAAGNLAHYPGKVRLMSVGFGEVATAVGHIAVQLDPDLPLFPGHSTDVAS